MNVSAAINSRPNKKQSGAALLTLMLILALTISTVLVTGAGKKSHTVKRDHVSSEALATAKNALIGYAYRNGGALPCPDLTGNGQESEGELCPSGSAVEGWLPWYTLGLKPLKDGDAICLRYAISADYADYLGETPATLEDGGFEIRGEDNSLRAGDIVAVVLAPLKALQGQLRGLGSGSATTCGSTDELAEKNAAINYVNTISGVNDAADPMVFIQASSRATFNDALIWLNTSDITGDTFAIECSVGYAPNAGGVCKNAVCDVGYTANNGGQCKPDDNGNSGGNGKGKK